MEDEPMVETYPFKEALIATMPEYRTLTLQILGGTQSGRDSIPLSPVITMTPTNVEDLIEHLQHALAEYRDKQIERDVPIGKTN